MKEGSVLFFNQIKGINKVFLAATDESANNINICISTAVGNQFFRDLVQDVLIKDV